MSYKTKITFGQKKADPYDTNYKFAELVYTYNRTFIIRQLGVAQIGNVRVSLQYAGIELIEFSNVTCEK